MSLQISSPGIKAEFVATFSIHVPNIYKKIHWKLKNSWWSQYLHHDGKNIVCSQTIHAVGLSSIYIYPIACIWHMAYGLTTTNHYCWKTTTILNYVTSYHITLHYSIFYRTKLLYSIWQYKWYNYIYTYILSHYILSYQIIFFYIFHPFVDYIHPYEASIPAIHRDLFPRSAHSPGFRKRRPRWCRWVRKSSPLPTATAPGKTMVARKKAG